MRFREPSKFYQIAKQIGTGRSDTGNYINIECIEDLTPKEQVAEYFADVSQQYSPIDIHQLPSYLPALPPPQIEVLSVWKSIKELKKTKSTLPGDLPDKLRKEASLFLAEPVTHIFNACLNQGVYPEPWKMESVTPVPKKTKLEKLSDVRKISSTSDFSKIFEKYLKQWILEDIQDMLSPSQYGEGKEPEQNIAL